HAVLARAAGTGARAAVEQIPGGIDAVSAVDPPFTADEIPATALVEVRRASEHEQPEQGERPGQPRPMAVSSPPGGTSQGVHRQDDGREPRFPSTPLTVLRPRQPSPSNREDPNGDGGTKNASATARRLMPPSEPCSTRPRAPSPRLPIDAAGSRRRRRGPPRLRRGRR